MQPLVIDISHHNEVTSFDDVAAHGIWGVIHKASQGSRYRDPDYATRRAAANAAGLLWGAYHFNDGSDVAAQVNNFIAVAQPGPDTLMALDFEDYPRSNMTAANAVKFLRLLEQKLGRKGVLYGGNRIKEQIGRLGPTDRAYLASHQLWLCQYGPHPELPPGFTRTFLWQYSDGRVGPGPHDVSGVTGDIDLNAFNGTRDELTASWALPTQPGGTSSVSRADDTGDSLLGHPTWLNMGVPTRGDGLNVQQPRAAYSIETEVVQRELDALGYHEVGDVDGIWGGRTAGAIRAFFNDRSVSSPPEMGPVLGNEIAKAKSEGWTRPIAPSRANATPKDIAPKVEAVQASLWGRFSAKVAAGAAAAGLTGSTISDTFSSVKSTLQPVHDTLNSVPGSVWFLLMLLVSGAVWYFTNRAANASTKDYNTGRLS